MEVKHSCYQSSSERFVGLYDLVNGSFRYYCNMVSISQEEIVETLDYNDLIKVLEVAFSSDEFSVPDRMHLDLPGDNISLVMPAWNRSYFGLKQIIACPKNSEIELPTIQGKYDLFDVKNGVHLAGIEPKKLTAIRTAATSVLAANYLKQKASSLLIMGAGVLAEEMIKAYTSAFDISEIIIWNRTMDHASSLVSKFEGSYPVKLSKNLPEEASRADIISCVTHSYEPILNGNWISPNTHIDLVGSYKKNMRETDDVALSKGDIYIDHIQALHESGDLCIPLASGAIRQSDIKGTLFDLCRKEVSPVQSERPTIFKSVGHAIEDLATAIYLFEKREGL